MTMHDFQYSLQRSQDPKLEPVWEYIYRKAFPDFDNMISHPCVKGWGQDAGIDRSVILKSSKCILIDEKVRYTDYGDILLEYWSAEERKTPGWICKDLACDYIAYLILPSKVCYMLPFQQLRKVWAEKSNEWIAESISQKGIPVKDKEKCQLVSAKNVSYTTISVVIPIKRLLKEMACSTRIELL